MITTIWGATKKPVSSDRLSDFFQNNPDLEGTLYIGYPIIGTPDGAFPIDALWINQNKGIVLFNLVEGKDVRNYEENLDDSANKLEAKLRNYKTLMNGRKLKISITPITFAPAIEKLSSDSQDHILANETNLKEHLTLISDRFKSMRQLCQLFSQYLRFENLKINALLLNPTLEVLN